MVVYWCYYNDNDVFNFNRVADIPCGVGICTESMDFPCVVSVCMWM